MRWVKWFRRPSVHGDDGLAVLAAVACILVVVSLTAVAVSQSLGSISLFSQSRKSLQGIDAATAGIQAEVATLETFIGKSPVAGTSIPCPTGTAEPVTPSKGVADPASATYYSLSLSWSPTETGPWSQCTNSTVPSTSPFYFLIQSKGSTSAATGGTSLGPTVQAVIRADDGVLPSSARGQYSSDATAQALNLSAALVGSALSTQATTASDNGLENDDVAYQYPGISILGGESWLTGSLLGQYAEADESGSSESCSGLVASGGSITLGYETNPQCTVSGTPASNGVALNLLKLPGLGGALTSIVGGLSLEATSMTSWASEGPGGTSQKAGASIANLAVNVSLLGGLVSVTIPVTLSSAANQNLLQIVISAIGASSNPLIAAVASTISSVLAAPPLCFGLIFNYQAPTSESMTASALHLQLGCPGSTIATGDLAASTAGPNSANPAGQTGITLLSINQAA